MYYLSQSVTRWEVYCRRICKSFLHNRQPECRDDGQGNDVGGGEIYIVEKKKKKKKKSRRPHGKRRVSFVQLAHETGGGA